MRNNNWIKCSDRLPESECWYLCYKNTWKKYVIMQFDMKRNGFFYSACSQPTHWMRLPALPEVAE
jgi:hypothetical protein